MRVPALGTGAAKEIAFFEEGAAAAGGATRPLLALLPLPRAA